MNGLVSAWNERGQSGQFVQKRGVRERASVEIMVALEWARAVASVFDLVVEDISAPPSDPPDCVGRVGELEISIELTELVTGELLSWASHALRQQRIEQEIAAAAQAGSDTITNRSQSFRLVDAPWTEARFREKVSDLLTKKSRRAVTLGRDFDYVVIYSGVPQLNAELVRTWLSHASLAKEDRILNAYLLLDYEPGGADHWPVFDLYGGK